MKKAVLSFKTIVLSDIHLGAPDCQADKINHFLKHTRSPRLILNGDIIDGWSLSRQGGWKKQHTRAVRLLLKKMEKKDTEIIYLRGNHDDILARFLPLDFENLKLVESYTLETGKGRYKIIHGDIFDAITQNSKWLAILGDIGYQWLLRINRFYNHYRAWRGKEYFSLSKAIKSRVKQAVSYVSSFEEQVQNLAKRENCIGIICGHIHTPADKYIGDVHYLNSGDWVESNTALVENLDGTWEILDFPTFEARLYAEAVRKAKAKGVPIHEVLDAIGSESETESPEIILIPTGN
ncbi:MAG: UDP-2,3-diacylglucosamine diphosphatase [Verrucomicrobiota bacterium]|nr:UDP-2,3-diacylglucosamine diphosphatase [Verrucomicrobiota bacterium]